MKSWFSECSHLFDQWQEERMTITRVHAHAAPELIEGIGETRQCQKCGAKEQKIYDDFHKIDGEE